MNTNRTAAPRPDTTPPGVATAWGLAIAAAVIAIGVAVGAFWTNYTVVSTPDGPAVVTVEVAP